MKISEVQIKKDRIHCISLFIIDYNRNILYKLVHNRLQQEYNTTLYSDSYTWLDNSCTMACHGVWDCTSSLYRRIHGYINYIHHRQAMVQLTCTVFINYGMPKCRQQPGNRKHNGRRFVFQRNLFEAIILTSAFSFSVVPRFVDSRFVDFQFVDQATPTSPMNN